MRATILIILLTLATGCRLAPGGGTPLAIDGEWQLQSGTNQGQAIPIVPSSRPTLKIDGDKVGGSSACNIYGGTITLDGSKVTISALSMTEMACDEDRMASEAAYLAALPRVTGAELSGDTLILTGPQVELRYTLVPPVADADLVGTIWILESLISGDAVSSTVAGRVTLELATDGTFAASTGCRDVTGRYQVTDGQVQVTLDPYDLIGCAAELGEQDQHILDVLAHGFETQIHGDQLTLTAGDQGIGYRAES
jgi:heat shock protein HslJ